MFNLFTIGRAPLKEIVLGASKQNKKHEKGLIRKARKTLILETSSS